MRRGLVHAAAWTAATGAAATLSWFGVHTALSGTAYDPPKALPLAGASPDGAGGTASPRVSSTHRPPPSPPSTSPPPTPEATRRSSHSAPGPGGTSPAGSAARGTVRSYTVSGGRVVLDLGSHSAELVSATPNAGWQVQMWKQDSWVRVDFTTDSRHNSVICTWNGHAPTVETDEHAT